MVHAQTTTLDGLIFEERGPLPTRGQRLSWTFGYAIGAVEWSAAAPRERNAKAQQVAMTGPIVVGKRMGYGMGAPHELWRIR